MGPAWTVFLKNFLILHWLCGQESNIRASRFYKLIVPYLWWIKMKKQVILKNGLNSGFSVWCGPVENTLNSSLPSAAYMRQWIRSALVQIMACHLFDAKPLSKPILGYCQLAPQEETSVKFSSKYKAFHSQKCIGKYRLRNGGHFVQEEMSLCQALECEVNIATPVVSNILSSSRPRDNTTWKSGFNWFYLVPLTLKHRETHGCIVSTVATDAQVLKHQAISILSTD